MYIYIIGKTKMEITSISKQKLSKTFDILFCIFTFVLFIYAYYDFSLFLSENYFTFWIILSLIILFLLVTTLNGIKEANSRKIKIKNKKIKNLIDYTLFILSTLPIMLILDDLSITEEVCHTTNVFGSNFCEPYFYLKEKSSLLASILIPFGMLTLVLFTINLFKKND